VRRPWRRDRAAQEQPPERDDDEHLCRRHHQLPGRQGEAAEVLTPEEPPQVGPAEAVRRAGHEGHGEAEHVGTPRRLPRLGDDDHADEPDRHRADLARGQPVGGDHQEGEQDRRHGGGRVADARQRAGDAFLTQGEEGEGQGAEQEPRHREVLPDPWVPRQPRPRHRREHQHGCRAREDAQGRDLHRREDGEADLDQQEARPPDEGEGGELCLPGDEGGATAQEVARSASSDAIWVHAC